MEDTLSLKSFISAEMEAFCAKHGFSATKIESAARQKIAGLKDERMPMPNRSLNRKVTACNR